MSGEFTIEDGQFVVRKDDRLVLSTSGTLVQFLTDEQTFNVNAIYPDVPKGEGYIVQWNIDYDGSGGEGFGYGITNFSGILARPQEWSNQIVLGTVPDGADIFIGRVTLNRTVNPSHSWANENLVPAVPMNQAMQITGSLLLEQVRCFCRAMSIYISGGNLIMDIQQSCGPVSGNFGPWGTPISIADAIGGENSAPSGAGKYVATAHPGFSGSGTVEKFSQSGPFPIPNLVEITDAFRNGGANQALYSDPTNYGATYNAIIKGRFGTILLSHVFLNLI